MSYHYSTCELLIGFYGYATRYIRLTVKLFSLGHLTYTVASNTIRSTLYFLHDQVHCMLSAVTRQLDRFNAQVHATLQVRLSYFALPCLFSTLSIIFSFQLSWVRIFGYHMLMQRRSTRYLINFYMILMLMITTLMQSSHAVYKVTPSILVLLNWTMFHSIF